MEANRRTSKIDGLDECIVTYDAICCTKDPGGKNFAQNHNSYYHDHDLGDRLNELALTLRRRERIHRKSVRRWVYAESGRLVPRVPREPWPSLVCHLLHERGG